ncbi:MAG: polysaccharide biosynthesis protein [Treponema sp.]|nr:polysaccharide biosynthesis protein [Treponema sp.]
MSTFDLDRFISDFVTKREFSLFHTDIQDNLDIFVERIQDKSVLVIGGAGSIGSSFIKSLLPFKPKSLVVVDISENGLAELTRDLRSTPGFFVPENYTPYPFNFSDKVFEKMFRAYGGFDIVANFSAHKHVRSEKDVFSVEALLKNNVFQVKKLFDLLTEFPPEQFFCVSTDKAVNPVNIMGASKKIMEELAFLYSDKYPVKTARFANVAFSNGSLPAGFLERINKRQPISAPSDVRRYFVSPQESGEICLLACMLGNNREIFFPKIEKSQMMALSDIALALLRERGYVPVVYDSSEEAIAASELSKEDCSEYPVYFSKSDTTGEKKYEEFYTNTEETDMKRFDSLGVIINSQIPDLESISVFLKNLENVFENANLKKSDVVNILEEFLPNFKHEEKNNFLDSKM